MESEIDAKYEFNAPKFIDFLQGDVDENSDKWFDERVGDEGGIDIDLAPYYEKELDKNRFQNATSAISAALKNNAEDDAMLTEEKVATKKENVEQSQPDDVVMETDCNDTSLQKEPTENGPPTVINKEKSLVQPLDIKKERMSYLPETACVGEKEMVESIDCNIKHEQICYLANNDTNGLVKTQHSNCQSDMQYSSNDENMLVAAVKDIKKERMSHVPTSESTTNSPAVIRNEDNSEPPTVVDVPAKAQAKRSNIRTSWDSPVNNGFKKERQMLPRRSQPLRSSAKKMNYDENKKRKHTLSQSNEPIAKKSKGELTKPETPSFVRKLRDRGLKRAQSTETMQLKQIRELQKQTRAQVKINDRNMKQALKAMPYQPVRSVNVTKTKEFQFATDVRQKDHPMQTRSEAHKPFEAQLRQRPPSPSLKKVATKPKPFHFLLADKVSAPVQGQKWESMAQCALNYQTKTPDRFRMRPKKGGASVEKDKQPTKVQITHPKTPKLMTKTRSRPVDVESAEERETKEAEAVKNYHFKATEFNPKIVDMQGMYGVKKMPEAQTTHVQPFNFEIESRIQQRKEKEEVNKTNSTASSKSKINRSLPTKGGERLSHTEVKPFSFETRDKERYQKKEEKIKSALQQEKEMREFHARPLPSFSPDALPVVTSKPATQAEPFQISSGSQAYQEKYKNKLLSEQEQEKSNRQFRAQSAVVVKNKPFKPLTGIKPPTCPDQVVLNSELRAKERSKYEHWKNEQEREIEMEKARIQKEKEEEEERQLKLLRKEAVPRSNPVRQYKPVEIHKSTKPLTVPQTPNLESKKRAVIRL